MEARLTYQDKVSAELNLNSTHIHSKYPAGEIKYSFGGKRYYIYLSSDCMLTVDKEYLKTLSTELNATANEDEGIYTEKEEKKEEKLSVEDLKILINNNLYMLSTIKFVYELCTSLRYPTNDPLQPNQLMKIKVIRIIRAMPGNTFGLKEAKDLVEWVEANLNLLKTIIFNIQF